MKLLEKDYNEKLAYTPSILIFVPDEWEGKYHDFEMDIQQIQRYWIDENGRSLIRE